MSINPATISPVVAAAGAAVGATTRPAPSALVWRRSSFSRGGDMTCVDVAFAPNEITVRDSKDPAGPVLRFSPREWEVFLLGVRNEEFDASPDQ